MELDLNKVYYAYVMKNIDTLIGAFGMEVNYDIALVYEKKENIFVNLKNGEIYKSNLFINGMGTKVVLKNSKIPFKKVLKDNKDKLTLKEVLFIDNKLIAKNINGKIKLYRRNEVKNMEQTFAIIKPDGLENTPQILEMIYNAGLKIKQYEIKQLDEELLKEHYAHIVDKPFYPELKNYMLSKPVVIMILEGDDAVKKYRDLMGPTDSKKANKGTIRGEFGTDITRNAVHGSDSKENAEIEINRFFRKNGKVKIK